MISKYKGPPADEYMNMESAAMHRCFYREGVSIRRSSVISIHNKRVDLYISKGKRRNTAISGVIILGDKVSGPIEFTYISNVYGFIHMDDKLAVFKVGKRKALLAKVLDDLERVDSDRSYTLAVIDVDGVSSHYKSALKVVLDGISVKNPIEIANGVRALNAVGMSAV